MMPQNVLSTTPEIGDLLPPRNARTETQYLTDTELGGVGYQNASQGLEVQDWTCTCDGTNFVISSATDPGGTTVLSVGGGGVTDMSFTFDQNMNIFITYYIAPTQYFYWFDSTVPGYVTTALPAGSQWARCTLDDKRPSQSGNSDILIAYTRASTMYFRQERDRYGIEYDLVGSLSDSRLINIGISTVLRMQFNLTPP